MRCPEVCYVTKRNLMHVAAGLIAGLLIGVFVFRTADRSAFPYLADAADRDRAAYENAAAPETTGPVIESFGTVDWCVDHSVPESACTLCHPDLISAYQAKNDWCVEHRLPESIDRLCHPELTFAQEPKSEPLPDQAYRPSVFFAKNSGRCETDDAIIRFATSQTAERAGLSLEPALAIDASGSVEAPAEILFDDTRSFVITTTIPALVSRWLVEPGEDVVAGQPLAEMESPDMPRLKADYLEALAEMTVETQNFSRADSLAKRDLISQAEVQQAEGRFQSAQARAMGAKGILEAIGLSQDDIQAVESTRAVTPRWLLRASANGALLERKAPYGELMPAGSNFALVGNPSALWIEANVRESDLSLFHKGEIVEFTSDGGALKQVAGRIIWVAQYIDPQTRTATVRAEVTSAPRDLRAHQFGRIALPTSPSVPTVAVPRDAVQWEGCCNVVFVQESSTVFRPHKVSIARGDRGYYNVNAGLRPGDLVVVKGSYSLKTELKKGSLGAGCCDVASRP